MRCYLLRDGHIYRVHELTGLSDEEAIDAGRKFWESQPERLDGFEVWDRDRKLIQYPPPTADEEPKLPRHTS